MSPVIFNAIRNDHNQSAWQFNFKKHWPAYKHWLESNQSSRLSPHDLNFSKKKLKSIMPELLPIYEQLCTVVDDDPLAQQFLTLYQPPAYLINCSQGVYFDEQPILIRNYDLSPELSENTLMHTNWQGRQVIATNECLWGVDDGMNDAGLALSLTFGGSKEVGQGFGIPIILRYVLQTCETVKQAITQLKRIPSHMAYNVTVIDKSGDFASVFLSPNHPAIVTRDRAVTNHQQSIIWPEQARFSKTAERKSHLKNLLSQKHLTEQQLIEHFHQAPLYSDNFKQHFGTVYTAVYKPLSAEMAYHWPGQQWSHSFDQFNSGEKQIMLADCPDQPIGQGDYAYQADRSDDFIPESIKPQLEAIFSYMPQSLVTNKSAYHTLKQNLNSDKHIGWSQFTSSMQQLWQ